MFSGSALDANTLPVPLGPPKRISPEPGPANPDPILQNLILDFTGTFLGSIDSNTFATSLNRGRSWRFGTATGNEITG